MVLEVLEAGCEFCSHLPLCDCSCGCSRGQQRNVCKMCILFPCTSHEMSDTVLWAVLWGFNFAEYFNEREGAPPVTAGSLCTSPGYRCARVRCLLALGAGT